jgi:hypothetical protein
MFMVVIFKVAKTKHNTDVHQLTHAYMECDIVPQWHTICQQREVSTYTTVPGGEGHTKKPETTDHTLSDSVRMNCSAPTNLQGWKVD